MKWTSQFPKEPGAYWYRDAETEAEVRLFFQGRAVWDATQRKFIFWSDLPYEAEFSNIPVQIPDEVKVKSCQ